MGKKSDVDAGNDSAGEAKTPLNKKSSVKAPPPNGDVENGDAIKSNPDDLEVIKSESNEPSVFLFLPPACPGEQVEEGRRWVVVASKKPIPDDMSFGIQLLKITISTQEIESFEFAVIIHRGSEFSERFPINVEGGIVQIVQILPYEASFIGDFPAYVPHIGRMVYGEEDSVFSPYTVIGKKLIFK